jgi:hypothetical protein
MRPADALACSPISAVAVERAERAATPPSVLM